MAKFKVGDKVHDRGLPYDVYKVIQVYDEHDYGIRGNFEWETAYANGDTAYAVVPVKVPGHRPGVEHMLWERADNLVLANSRSTNAKFKVGDLVETEWGTGRIARLGGVEKYGGEETYGVILDKRPYGRGMYLKEHELKPYQKFPNSVRSTNAVVAKALNAARAQGRKEAE